MASMTEARIPYTGGHLWRVSQFSRILAEDADLSGQEVARVAVGVSCMILGTLACPMPSSTSRIA